MAHRFRQIAAGLLFLLIPSTLCAQFAGPNVPMVASGQRPTAVPGDGAGRSNLFSASFAVAARFDDGLTYDPGFDTSEHGFFGEQFTNVFNGHFTWLLSKHSSFSVQQNYVLSTNPFQQFGSQPFTTAPGPVVAPNPSVFLTNVRRTSNFSQAHYSYQPSQHTTVGLSGNYGLSHFGSTSSSPTNATLLGFQTVSGQAYVFQQITPRNQLGIQYSGSVLKFQQVSARTTTHSLSIFDEVQLTPNTSFTLYAGPQYSMIFNQVALNAGFAILNIPIRQNTLSWSGGAIYKMTGRRGAMVLNYSHAVSDGGGVTGAVVLNAGSAHFNWQLSPNWSMKMDLMAADSQLLTAQSGGPDFRSYSATLGFGRRIYKNASMNLFFERLNQTGSIIGLSSGNHNLAGVSISYDFSRPIGR